MDDKVTSRTFQEVFYKVLYVVLGGVENNRTLTIVIFERSECTKSQLPDETLTRLIPLCQGGRHPVAPGLWPT
jgi:hypothetical protein